MKLHKWADLEQANLDPAQRARVSRRVATELVEMSSSELRRELGVTPALRLRLGGAYIVITMKARLVRIGNSRGIRLPKAIIDQVGLNDEVELLVEGQRLVIVPARRPRAGWAEAVQTLGADQAKQLDASTPTRFDETEWRW